METCIFGPVPSRRLGRSLGVDLVPYKTCSYDCIYCQLGRTTRKTIERKEWVPIDEMIASLRDRLSASPDHVTLSGSGEPTLHCRIGEVIDRIKGMTDVPVAVLTNGSLLWQEEVRRQLLNADVVIPSLDAANDAVFRRVNRPHDGISFEEMVLGLLSFRQEFRGELWLEVFLLAGSTAADAHVASLAEIARQIGPSRIQLNTVTRPAVESFAVAVSEPRMQELARRFDPPAEVIGRFCHPTQAPETAGNREHVLDLLRRRPCTLDDVAGGLKIHPAEVVKYIEELTAQKLLLQTWAGGRCHYQTSQ
jgi:wyosine [tRNA(Phe)-imidazoG37] synthetase (radical SAM superfamily)